MEKEFLSFLKNTIEIIGIIGGFGSILAVIHFIVNYYSKTIFSKMFAEDILENRSEWNRISYLLKHYIPHRFKEIEGDGEELTYNEFKHAIRERRYVVVVGSAGIGKSALMIKLAFTYKRAFSKTPINLEDLSIIYYKISRGMTVESIAEGISKELEKHPKATVLIDGFDELNCIQGNDAYEQLVQMIDGLQRKRVSGKCNKLIISTRKEVFADGIKSIGNIQFGESSPAIFEILPFSEKQAMNYFNRFFCGTKKRKKYRILKSVLENNPTSIFQYPFILQFVDDILETQELRKLSSMDLFTALKIIVKNGLWRECAIYNKFIGERDRKINDEAYVASGISFLNYIAHMMLESDNMRDYITRAELKEYENSAGGNDVYLSDLLHDNNMSTTRRLLKYNDRKKAYEFIHSMLYEYFIAHVILCGEYTREERKTYIDRLSSSRTLIPEFYCKAAVERYYSAIDIDGMLSISEWDISKIKSLQYIPQTVTVESVLRVFPYAESICIDGKIVIDDEEFDNLLYGHTLNLSHRSTIDLAYLKCFEPETIHYLELVDNSLLNINANVKNRICCECSIKLLC